MSVLIIMCLTLLVIMFVVLLVVIVILLMIWLPSILALGILSGLGRIGFALRLTRTMGPAKEITHDGLHPLRKRGKSLAQVIADGGAVCWIVQNRDEARADSIQVAGQQVAQPIERLNNAHGGTPRPMQAARRRMLKLNGQVAKLDRFQPSIRKDDRARRHRIGESQIVGRGDPVDNHPHLVAPGEGVDHVVIIGIGGFAGQLIYPRPVVQSASDSAESLRGRETVQGLIHRFPGSQIQKVDGRPNSRGGLGGHSVKYYGSEIESQATH
jgi:hypothetical protein